MNNFLVKVASTIEKFNMANKSERLLVCLSGGADSVVGYCKEHSVSTEEGARKLRYDFFDSIGADKICTAHSLSDCLETAIFNLARGSGLKGICGIPPVRGNIIRPLINCTRQEIEGFLKERGQDFVTDSTNLTDDYTRNKIRHLVVPRLAELNSSLFGSYSMTADRLRTDSDYLESQGLEAFEKAVLPKGYDALCLRQLHESVRRRAIMHILEKEGLTVSHDSIEDIEGEKIRLVNRDFDSDVRKLVNKSFRLEDRSSAVILKDSHGVVFVEGSGAAERVKIDSETVKILAFTIK